MSSDTCYLHDYDPYAILNNNNPKPIQSNTLSPLTHAFLPLHTDNISKLSKSKYPTNYLNNNPYPNLPICNHNMLNIMQYPFQYHCNSYFHNVPKQAINTNKSLNTKPLSTLVDFIANDVTSDSSDDSGSDSDPDIQMNHNPKRAKEKSRKISNFL